MWSKSAGNEDGQLAERVTTTNATILVMHPYLIIHARKVYGQVVVRGGGKVRVEYRSILFLGCK